jgi:hypothetical protein
MSGLLAGADARIITPALEGAPVFLAGFQGNRRATVLDRDLFVRTLALAEVGTRPFVLAVCDLIGVLRADTLAIRAAVADLGIDIVVAATHTHSGPDTIGLWGPDDGTRGVDEGYLAVVRATVETSIRAAVAALEPAMLRAASTTVEGVIQNYRDPEVLDTQVGVVALDRPAGSTIATLVNVGVHPEVLDGDSTAVSSDLAGATCRELEDAFGGTAIWVSGDLGGMQSPVEGPRTPSEVGRKADLVAAAAIRSLAGVPITARPRVRYRGAEVGLPLWNPRYRAGLAAGLLHGDLLEDGTLTTDVGVLDLGVARAACWPGEVLPALGLRSKARLDTPVPLLFGLANDELGYILADEDFVEPTDWDDPGRQYEESMSVGPETGSRLLRALDELRRGTDG